MKRFAATISAFMILLLTIVFAVAQAPRTDVAVFKFGDQQIRIPAPEGFEEAASQFENIKDYFTRTEDPRNDMLAVHLLRADCEKLRANQFGTLNFYTKVSAPKSGHELDYSAADFTALIKEFRKSGAQYLDVNGPLMKDTMERVAKSLSELKKEETHVDLAQPVNLGEFDTRPNIYSIMLLLSVKTQSSKGEVIVPIAGGLTFVRVKQRLIYVYTYRRVESKADVEILRDFSKKWTGEILAAN